MEKNPEGINHKCVKKTLQKSARLLCENLRPDNILRTLISEDALGWDDQTKIKKKDTDTEKVEALIDFLMKSPVSSYEAFMEALKEERPDLHIDVKAIQEREASTTTASPMPVRSASAAAAASASPLPVRSAIAAVSHNPHRQVVDSASPYIGHPSDELDEVVPDSDGLYKSRHVKPATPTVEQLDPLKNYQMSSADKGLAYILNNRYFPGKAIERVGSDEDFANMKHLFTELGYEIIEHENLNANDIRESIEKFVGMFDDNSHEYMSAVIVLMSHGQRDEKRGCYIIGTDGEAVFLEDVEEKVNATNCRNLRGKPKLFFIQACRGVVMSHPVEHVEADVSGSPAGSTEVVQSDSITEHADMHIAFASPEGHLSLRSHTKGSWFIQAISEVFLAHAHEADLDTLMNMVTQKVIKRKGQLYDANGQKVCVKQTPERVSRMTKTLYFLPKYPPV